MINLWRGGKLLNTKWLLYCQMENIQTTKWKIPKLPNENIQTYQLQMINSGGGVNYQMQIVTSFFKLDMWNSVCD